MVTPPKANDLLAPEQMRTDARLSPGGQSLEAAHAGAPYWVNYHREHHLFMFVSCWRLPAAHRALIAAGRGNEMELQPSYRAVLRKATSPLVDAAGGSKPKARRSIFDGSCVIAHRSAVISFES